MIPESPGWDPPIITLRVVGSSYVFKSVFDRLKVLLRFKGGFTTSNGAIVRFRYFLSYFRVFLTGLRSYNVITGGLPPGDSGIMSKRSNTAKQGVAVCKPEGAPKRLTKDL